MLTKFSFISSCILPLLFSFEEFYCLKMVAFLHPSCVHLKNVLPGFPPHDEICKFKLIRDQGAQSNRKDFIYKLAGCCPCIRYYIHIEFTLKANVEKLVFYVIESLFAFIFFLASSGLVTRSLKLAWQKNQTQFSNKIQFSCFF